MSKTKKNILKDMKENMRKNGMTYCIFERKSNIVRMSIVSYINYKQKQSQ